MKPGFPVLRLKPGGPTVGSQLENNEVPKAVCVVCASIVCLDLCRRIRPNLWTSLNGDRQHSGWSHSWSHHMQNFQGYALSIYGRIGPGGVHVRLLLLELRPARACRQLGREGWQVKCGKQRLVGSPWGALAQQGPPGLTLMSSGRGWSRELHPVFQLSEGDQHKSIQQIPRTQPKK